MVNHPNRKRRSSERIMEALDKLGSMPLECRQMTDDERRAAVKNIDEKFRASVTLIPMSDDVREMLIQDQQYYVDNIMSDDEREELAQHKQWCI